MASLGSSTEKGILSSLNDADEWTDSSNLRLILEETMDEMKKNSWERVRKRVKSQNLRSVYLGVTKEGIILYKTTSGTTPGKWWHQRIYFEDLPDVIQILNEDPTFTARDAILLAMKGDIRVHCDDPSWKYWGWQYIGTKKGYALREEKRFPKKRNPRLTGSVCKHLLSVFATIPFDWSKIVKDMRSKGIIPKYKRRRKKSVKKK